MALENHNRKRQTDKEMKKNTVIFQAYLSDVTCMHKRKNSKDQISRTMEIKD